MYNYNYYINNLTLKNTKSHEEVIKMAHRDELLMTVGKRMSP